MKKQTKSEILDALVREGMGEDHADVLSQLEDMGITWQDVRDAKWY